MPPRTPLTDAEAGNLRALHRTAATGTHYDVLGVAPSATRAEIEAAFHAFARSWHPDRFFSRDLGDLALSLEEVFVAATRAFRVLGDAAQRATYDRSLVESGRMPRAQASSPAPAAPRPAGVAPVGAPLPPRPRSAAFQQVQGQVMERIQKARALVKQAREDMAAGQWTRAESNLKLALGWDPQDPEAKALMDQTTRQANVQRAKVWMAQAESEESIGRNREALVLYKRVAETEPDDAAFWLKLGRLCVSVDQDDRGAINAFRKAVLASPQDVESNLALAEAYLRVGLTAPAKRCAETVLAVDPKNSLAKGMLRKL